MGTKKKLDTNSEVMDPNANWDEAVRLARTLVKWEDDEDNAFDARRLAELVLALPRVGEDDFLCGFGLAVAEMIGYGASFESASQAMSAAGISLRDLRRAGLESFDTDRIRKAMPRERTRGACTR